MMTSWPAYVNANNQLAWQSGPAGLGSYEQTLTSFIFSDFPPSQKQPNKSVKHSTPKPKRPRLSSHPKKISQCLVTGIL
jgi:hypothetical protein